MKNERLSYCRLSAAPQRVLRPTKVVDFECDSGQTTVRKDTVTLSSCNSPDPVPKRTHSLKPGKQRKQKENVCESVFSSIQTFVEKQRGQLDVAVMKDQTDAYQNFLKYQIQQTQATVKDEIEAKLLKQNYLLQDQIDKLTFENESLKESQAQAVTDLE